LKGLGRMEVEGVSVEQERVKREEREEKKMPACK
jgi:hypothetical protein